MPLPSAVLIDTVIFDGQAYDFASPTVEALLHLAKRRKLKLVLPDPIEREVRRLILASIASFAFLADTGCYSLEDPDDLGFVRSNRLDELGGAKPNPLNRQITAIKRQLQPGGLVPPGERWRSQKECGWRQGRSGGESSQ